MVTNDKKINDLFLYWLIFSLALVFFIILIGGLDDNKHINIVII